MKKIKTVSAVLLTASLGTNAWAIPAPARFELNASTLRQQLLPSVNDKTSGNISLLTTLLQVHDARDEVWAKRAALLPSLNLTAAMNIASSGPSFLLSTVDFLLPFLVPGNWFNLYAEKDQFEAEEVSYKILELNTYSEALSVYYTSQADSQSQALYQQQATDLGNIAKAYAQQYKDGFITSDTTVLQAQADAEQAQSNASQNAELVDQETAIIRSMLGEPLNLDTKIVLEPSNIPASIYENGSLDQAQIEAERMSPEALQIAYLVQAAGEEKWAAVFGFVNSADLGINTGGSGVGSKGTDITGSFSFGFGTFPDVSLAARSIQEIQNQLVSLKQTLGDTVETSINSIRESSNQLSLVGQAVANYEQVYQEDLLQNQAGQLSYTDLLVADENLTTAKLAQVRAQLDLNLQRLNLHRVMISYEFANIKGCGAVQQKPGFLGGVFGNTYSNVKLDEVCREGGSTIPVSAGSK